MHKNIIYILMFILLSSFVLGAPKPFIQASEGAVYQIETPQFSSHQVNKDFKIHAHVINVNGSIVDNTTAYCFVHLYNKSGSHILKENMSFEEVDFEIYLNKSYFKEEGRYWYIIQCESFSGYEGGFLAGEYVLTTTGNFESDEEEGLKALALIVGICLSAIALLYFAFQLNEQHFILKLMLIFFGLIFILSMPYVVLNGYKMILPSIIKICFGVFGFFVAYFMFYMLWHYLQKSEKFICALNKIKSSLKGK